ncbi:MAG: gamma-glutamyltransferase [Acidobacteriota bacterium]|jgi:gamma-glutamyltranspeptidase/glutathione hydrolase
MTRSSKLTALLVSLALLFAACSPAPAPSADTTAGAGSAAVIDTADNVAVGSQGAVASVDGYATQVGIEVLQAGGNAIDAAVAVGFALAVTHPAAGNIGGGGFMTIYIADEDRYTTFDFRERAPLAATEDMYMQPDGTVDRGGGHVGWTAVGVPGTVAGFALAHEKLGTLPWERLVEPAAGLARDGIVLGEYLADSLEGMARRDAFASYPASKEAFLKPDGTSYAAGETFVQPDLAWSLQQIADNGPDAFYRGEIAERLTAAMADNGGLITMEDLAAYEAKEREPIRGTYRGYDIISMPPPSSGGTVLVEMLNILENFDLAGYDAESPEVTHLMIEAMRQGYLDRATYLGDTDFVEVPIDMLTSKDYAAEKAAMIPLDRARSSEEIGASILTPPESTQTTQYSVVDAAGNVVSTTYTLEQGYGSKAMAPGTGFLLNNEMGDFNTWPGMTWDRYIGTPPNLIAPGKRMLSSMTPTIVARDGHPIAAVGSPGGKTIINTVFCVVVNLIDFDKSLADAVAAPRLHNQWMPDSTSLESDFPQSTLDALIAMGHIISDRRGIQGDAHSVYIAPDGTRIAVADPRRNGAAMAY